MTHTTVIRHKGVLLSLCTSNMREINLEMHYAFKSIVVCVNSICNLMLLRNFGNKDISIQMNEEMTSLSLGKGLLLVKGNDEFVTTG